MLWSFIGNIFSVLLSLVRVSRLSENDKDLEIIILRHQLDVMARKQKQPIRPNRAEKATLALLTGQFKKNTNRTIRKLGDVIRIEGELKKLGFVASLTTVRNVLDRNGIVPAPVRFGSIGWKTMMNHYKDQLLACDFFTVETIFLKHYYYHSLYLCSHR